MFDKFSQALALMREAFEDAQTGSMFIPSLDLAAEVDACSVGEKTLAQRLYQRLRADELLTADRGFYSWQGWDTAAAKRSVCVTVQFVRSPPPLPPVTPMRPPST